VARGWAFQLPTRSSRITAARFVPKATGLVTAAALPRRCRPPSGRRCRMSRREHCVIIVDDEARMRDLLADVIPEMGFPVTAARCAEEAIRIMTARRHDIAILDLHLPAMDGMALFDTIRERWPE